MLIARRDSTINNHLQHMPDFIPLEIVNEIAHYLCPSQTVFPTVVQPPSSRRNRKPVWQSINALSLASRSFRTIALSVWFQHLYLQDSRDINDIPRYFAEIKTTWCRYLHCVQTDENRPFIWDLSGFNRVEYLRVHWLQRDLTLLGTVVAVMPIPDWTPFVNVESHIKELDIRGLRYPSPMALRSLISPFSDLTVLRIEALRVWCGLCHTCVLVRFPSPAPSHFAYEDGIGLPVHYSRLLSSLKSLQEVHITLPDLGFGLTSHGLSPTINDNMWAGECDRCMALMYKDENFRSSWLARKKGQTNDPDDSNSRYTKPPKLRKVQWSFWPFESSLHSESGYIQEEVSPDNIIDFDTEPDIDDSEGSM